jgi:hypothetical protein
VVGLYLLQSSENKTDDYVPPIAKAPNIGSGGTPGLPPAQQTQPPPAQQPPASQPPAPQPPVQQPPAQQPPPAQPNMATICATIIQANQAKLVDVNRLGYGWEGWLQVEVALALGQLPVFQGTQPQREVAIYKKQRTTCDIWIPGTANRANIAIELKTKTRTGDFASRVKTDYTDKCKLSDSDINDLGLKAIYDPQQVAGQQRGSPTIVWGIGITPDRAEAITAESMIKLEAFQAAEQNVFTQGMMDVYDANVGVGIHQYLVWWRQEFCRRPQV